MAKRIELTAEEREMSIGELMKRHGLTKSTAWRALQRGYYLANHHNTRAKQDSMDAVEASLPPVMKPKLGERVVLTEQELKLSGDRLARRYGISDDRALVALRTGSFVYKRRTTAGEWISFTAEDQRLPVAQLIERFRLSRSRAYRAKRAGGFCSSDKRGKEAKRRQLEILASLPPVGSLQLGQVVDLSEEELLLGPKQLCKRYAISRSIAVRALNAGSFVYAPSVPVSKKALPSPPKWTPSGPSGYDPTSAKFRVNLAPAELGYPTKKLLELYAHLGLSESQVRAARVRGYFCPNADRPFEPVVDEQKFAALAKDVAKDARTGAISALKKFLGDRWAKEMRGYGLDDVVSAAIEGLHERSGMEGFDSPRWRVKAAKNAALRFLGREARKRRREDTTVDRLEGRIDEE